MKAGDKVVIKRKRKNGEIYFDSTRKVRGTVIKEYENFILVQYEKGYRECFRKSDLNIDS